MEAQAESDGLRDLATQMDQETKVEPGYRRTESTEVKPEVRRSPMQLQGWKNEEQPKVWKSLAMTDQGDLMTGSVAGIGSGMKSVVGIS